MIELYAFDEADSKARYFISYEPTKTMSDILYDIFDRADIARKEARENGEPSPGETFLGSMLQTEALTTAIMEKRGAKILALTLENETMRHLLASLEWSAYRVDPVERFVAMCPCCRFDKRLGHRENCALVAAIAGKGAA